jgi:chemotaxis protein CheD
MMDIGTNKQHFLMTGGIFAHEEAHVVTTILGSCISVCLWDPVGKVGGINHYMLPLWNGEGLATPKYGSIAIPKLIEKMIGLGCSKKNLRAKIFGGGEVFNGSSFPVKIGDRNIHLAQDLLEAEKIPVVGFDMGGKTGRKILYHTGTGDVLVKRLKQQVDDVKTS